MDASESCLPLVNAVNTVQHILISLANERIEKRIETTAKIIYADMSDLHHKVHSRSTVWTTKCGEGGRW